MEMTYAQMDTILMLLNPIAGVKLYGVNNLRKHLILSELKQKLVPVEASRTEVIVKFCNKDEEGKPVIVTKEVKNEDGTVVNSGKQYDVPEDKVKECNEEISLLYVQTVDVEFKKIEYSAIDKACQDNPDITPDWTEYAVFILQPVIDFEK